MKAITSLLITGIFFQLSISSAFPNNTISLKDEWETGHSISADYDELDRDILSIRYWSDAGEIDFVLRNSVLFGDRNNEKSTTDTIIYHNIFGGVYYYQYITYEKDQLGRDTSITWIDNEGGGPNFM